jgi:hypothetical protein
MICVFMAVRPPAKSVVQVFEVGNSICIEACENAKDAAAVAARLKAIFVTADD